MWLYVPETSCPSALEQADSNSESCSLSTAAPRLAEASVTWRGKHLPLPAWSRRWRAGGFIRLLSGVTCSPSTLEHGVASFISSLRATHARTTLSPESAPEATESGSLPRRSSGSPTSAGLILSSARTCRGTQASSLAPSSRHWSEWATALRQEYSARPKPETPCGASDCSSWPAPDTQNMRDGSNLRQITLDAMERGARRGVSLHHEAENWKSPAAQDPGITTERLVDAEGNPWTPGQRAYDVETGRLAQSGLTQQAEIWNSPRTITGGGESAERKKELGRAESGGGDLQAQATNWSSPKASDPEKAGPNMRGSKGDVPLPGQAAQWAAPMASDDGQKATQASHQNMLCNQAPEVCASLPQLFQAQPTTDGSMSSTDGPNSNRHSAKRKLNPIFVEALMRWPTGLSGFERQETAWTRWWLLMPSFVSALVSQKPQAQAELF